LADPRVIASQDGAVGLITLNHPKANNYDLHFMKDLDAAIESMSDNDSVRVVVMKSGLEKFFSAGADINAFLANTTQDNMTMIRFAHEMLSKIAKVPKIFIAALGGHALGGGLEMALACDLRTAADGKFGLGLPEVKLGLLPGNGGTQRMPRLIGRTAALSLMITGEPVSPRRAHELGFVDQLFPPESYLEETMAFARKLATGATRAVADIKRAIHEGMEMPLDQALALECEMFGPALDSADGREGMTAFVERREAVFTGR
jgi:enoyl-CoA hydratase/carnithine racemase